MTLTIPYARISPPGYLDLLSQGEARRLLENSKGEVQSLFRSCSLAVLNCGKNLDDSRLLLEQFENFDIKVRRENSGIQLELINGPASAFVDGQIIQGISEHLFAVLRDIVYVEDEITNNPGFELSTSRGITNAIFYILRNAGVIRVDNDTGLVVCWGGHSICREEYDYTKEVGHQLGLRRLNICTGCGAGAMKGPMKGAAIGHFKQRMFNSQYLGITEPGIIAAESPNPIVNDLVIMPDIEKRLEAFVRTGHGVIVFPGGVGTAEEILFLLAILLDPANANLPFPFILSGPAKAKGYFQQIDEFIGAVLGEEARAKYQIIIDDPEMVAQKMAQGIAAVRSSRKRHGDTFFYNWRLTIRHDFQKPFEPTHENMLALNLSKKQSTFKLANNLRKAFSGIVAGNVKKTGMQAIEERGLFQLRGQADIMAPLDTLLRTFVKQHRMKIPSDHQYTPCYRLLQDGIDPPLRN
ncbi:MAG: nucleotide 5'-monophosphate nucleosidase PpnN [Desulfopila sp.]